jgi:hypothetical protein
MPVPARMQVSLAHASESRNSPNSGPSRQRFRPARRSTGTRPARSPRLTSATSPKQSHVRYRRDGECDRPQKARFPRNAGTAAAAARCFSGKQSRCLRISWSSCRCCSFHSRDQSTSCSTPTTPRSQGPRGVVLSHSTTPRSRFFARPSGQAGCVSAAFVAGACPPSRWRLKKSV